MKAKLKVNANLILEVEGDDFAEVFKGLAIATEIFEHAKCGCCSNPNIRHVVRIDDEKNEYYELHCTDVKCRARLPFGQMKKPAGQLYPKNRWDQLSVKEKQKRAKEEEYANTHHGYLSHNGWYKYVPDKKTEEQK